MVKKKKILYLVRLAPPVHGAAKMNDIYLNSKLINKKYNINYIKLNNYSNIKDIGKFNFKSIFNVFRVFFKLLYKLVIFRPNKVYLEMAPFGSAFLRDSIYVWLAKLFRKDIFIHFHAKGLNFYLSEHKSLEKYYKKVFKKTKVILLSPLLYSSFSKVISKKQVFYLPNGIKDEISEFKFNKFLKYKFDSKQIKFVYLSNMIKSKGPLDVLYFLKELEKNKIKYTCDFIGAWSSDEFKEKWNFTKNKLKLKNCNYLGPIYGSKKYDYLLKSNYLIFPTKYEKECFPLVILEAYMCGCSVLSYNNGAIKDIVVNKLGYISNKCYYKDFVNYIKLNQLNKNKSKYIRKYFLNNYLIDYSEEKLIDIFESK
ncbi:MAG: glycosyltransferase family 4 protein [Candidatus ainarchaeum sp.]|nr:glycosyltransferase family 4 protein [Candidatus ainarchaeum sp.]MDD3975605.1 glycosyltransferase family 4 protein [Candidatus ainarchaeum sp.]